MNLIQRRQPLRAGVAAQLFDRIPLELLQEIFLCCLSPPSVIVELPYLGIDLQEYSPRIAPFLLCQICRSWRQAAISFPNIWTSLEIFVSGGKARPSASLATTWLARSGSLPLSLSLYQQNESNDNRIAAGEILKLYLRYTSRWRNIHFDLTSQIFCHLQQQQRSAPMLNEFNIRMSYQQEALNLFGIFDFVPCLSNLRVSIPDLKPLCSMPIPWFQLSSLSLDYVPSVCASLHILEKCPSLTNVSFKVDSNGPPPINQVYHCKLRSLTINIGHYQLSLFLEHVTFPGLTQVTIYGSQWPPQYHGWPQIKLEEFLERSQCRLVHFEMHYTGMNYTDFAACVCNRRLQSLVRFIVEDMRDWTWDPVVTDQAVGFLTCPSSGGKPCFLPNLESLGIRGTILWTADGMVAGMVESRWRFHYGKGIKRLKRVELEMPSSHHVEDIRRLKEFYNEGLELDIILR